MVPPTWQIACVHRDILSQSKLVWNFQFDKVVFFITLESNDFAAYIINSTSNTQCIQRYSITKHARTTTLQLGTNTQQAPRTTHHPATGTTQQAPRTSHHGPRNTHHHAPGTMKPHHVPRTTNTHQARAPCTPSKRAPRTTTLRATRNAHHHAQALCTRTPHNAHFTNSVKLCIIYKICLVYIDSLLISAKNECMSL